MKQYMTQACTALFAGILSVGVAFAGNPSGCWNTIDDKTGQKKGLVRISAGNSLSGTLKKTYHLKNNICTTCSGRYKNKNIANLRILWGFKRKSDDQWVGGTILDPKNGKTYTSTVTLSGNKLLVRGYMGPFYRTQTWYRAGCR